MMQSSVTHFTSGHQQAFTMIKQLNDGSNSNSMSNHTSAPNSIVPSPVIGATPSNLQI